MSKDNLLPVYNQPVPEYSGDVEDWATRMTAFVSDASNAGGSGDLQFPVKDNLDRVIIDRTGFYLFDSFGTLFVSPDIVNINTEHLVDTAITTAKLANLAVDNTKLADLAVESAKLADSAVTSTKIANLAVGTAAIANAAIGTAQIANLAVTSALIGDAAIVTAKIADLAVNSAQIANAAIDSAKIANLAVVNAHLVNGAIDNLKITNSLNSSDFAFTPGVTATGWSIQGSQSGAGLMTVNKITIADDSGNVILESGATATGQLVDDTATAQSTADTAIVDANNALGTPTFYQTTEPATDGPIGSVWVHSTTKVMKQLIGGVWENIGFSEPITSANITTFISGAAIGNAQIGNLAVGTAQIALGAIGQAQIGVAAIGTAEIADAAITSLKIGNTLQSSDFEYTPGVSATGWRISGAQTAGGLFEGSRIKLYDSSGNILLDTNLTSGQLIDDIATAGDTALWTSLGGKPVDADLLNALQEWGDLQSRPADSALLNINQAWTELVGRPTDTALLNINQDWSDVSNIPANIDSLIGTETILNSLLGALSVLNTIDGDVYINSGTIIADLMAVDSILAASIAANAVTAVKIQANAITASKILAGSVTASKISVTDLSALNADVLGSIKVGSLGQVDIDGTNQRIDVTDGTNTRVRVGNLGADYGIELFDSSGVKFLTADGQGILSSGSTVGSLNMARGLETGQGRDGNVKSFGNTWDIVPTVKYSAGGLSFSSTLTGDQFQSLTANAVSVTGFTISAKITELAGVTTNVTDAGATSAGTHDWEIHKSSSLQAFDDTYTFNYTPTIRNEFDAESGNYFSGQITVTFYTASSSGVWVARGTSIHSSGFNPGALNTTLAAQTKTIVLDGLTNHGGREFAISITSDTQGGSTTVFTNVTYTTASTPASVSATPTGAPDVQYFVLGG